MALRVLTSEEKQTLLGNQSFIDNVQWSIRDYASYWSGHDGAGLDNTARIKWAKDRILSVPIVLGDITDSSAPLQYLKLAKGIQVDLGTAPVAASVIVAALIAGNKFEELASMYFSLIGESVNFSTSGN